MAQRTTGKAAQEVMTSDSHLPDSLGVIKMHGGNAPIYASMRHDELLMAGDAEGCVAWQQVLKAIEELCSKEVPDGTRIQ